MERRVTSSSIVRNFGTFYSLWREVDVGDGGVIVMKQLVGGEPHLLGWGKDFADRHKIAEDQILHAVKSARKSLFRHDYA